MIGRREHDGNYHQSGGSHILVLSRHRDESIIIDGHITITVIEIRADKVRLGIAAPANITVHREEVQREVDARIESERRAAAREDQAFVDWRRREQERKAAKGA